jgi:hypothetical protein
VADTAIAQVAEDLGERPSRRQMGQVMKAATAIAAGKGRRRPAVGGRRRQAVAVRQSFFGGAARVLRVP